METTTGLPTLSPMLLILLPRLPNGGPPARRSCGVGRRGTAGTAGSASPSAGARWRRPARHRRQLRLEVADRFLQHVNVFGLARELRDATHYALFPVWFPRVLPRCVQSIWVTESVAGLFNPKGCYRIKIRANFERVRGLIECEWVNLT